MLKRFHIEQLSPGLHHLDAVQSRHARDVLRLEVGAEVELFDGVGRVATAQITSLRPEVQVAVEALRPPAVAQIQLAVAAAVPKGARADWLVEKLSELGAAAYIPLESSRSVVLPESGKLSRWRRIASESAKQCRRNGIMDVHDLSTIPELVQAAGYDQRWCLSTAPGARPLIQAVPDAATSILAAIGPEGGWTDAELASFADAGFIPVSLTRTVLRIETAAIAVAAVVMSIHDRKERA